MITKKDKMKHIQFYCQHCNKTVTYQEGKVRDNNGKEFNVYIHKTNSHDSMLDKELMDLIIPQAIKKSEVK